jgi:hypothetical protein
VGLGPHVRGWSAAFGEDEEARRFAFFAHGDRRPRSMTRGPGPPCQRLARCFRRRWRGAAVCSSRGGSPSLHTETDAQGV